MVFPPPYVPKSVRASQKKRDNVMCKSPLVTGEMLTREEFEHLQHFLRMESSLLQSHATFTPAAPAPLLPPSIPMRHPPPVIYPTPALPPATPPGQYVPTHSAVMLPPQPQPMMMLVHEQPRPLPAPSRVERPTQLVAPSHQVYSQFAQPLGPPKPQCSQPPGNFQHGTPQRPAAQLPPGNPQPFGLPSASYFVHLQP